MILEDILTHKRKEVEEMKLRFSIDRIKQALEAHQEPIRPFSKKFRTHHGQIHLIAEIKKASPSAGVLRQDFNHLKLAQLYEAGGASALSILTETRYFLGRPSYLKTVHAITHLPVLRKDFIIDPYQIYESRLLSADAVLLIADILTLEELASFRALAESLGMEALVEAHSEEDMKKAVDAGARLIGINNRNLSTLRVSTSVGEKLIPLVPKGATIVIESGIEKYEEIMKFKSLGAHAFLVGTSLLRSPNIIGQLHHLKGIGIAS
jgi:indole-3-glycerol phosphate synthase